MNALAIRPLAVQMACDGYRPIPLALVQDIAAVAGMTCDRCGTSKPIMEPHWKDWATSDARCRILVRCARCGHTWEV